MIKMKRLVGGNLESNGYTIYQKEGGEAFIIDPGYNPDRFLKILRDLDLTLKGILLTHHHYDHVGGVEKLCKETGCPVYLHREDLDQYRRPVDVPLEDGDQLTLEGEEIKVLHTPGHTAGSVCFYCPQSKLVFTGDTVFDTDLGRTDLAGGSAKAMRESIQTVDRLWGNEITIYPGHDGSATMKFVRQYNQEYQDCLKA